MNNLNVIDVSAVVYTGASAQRFCERTSFGYPVGGIHYLMRQLCVSFGSYDAAVLCFDSPTRKQELLSGYKAGRIKRPKVYSQIEFLYEGMMSCGIACEKHDGFEADDVVDWAVKQGLGKYTEVVIVGNDYDLLHSVQPGVRFKSIRRGVSCVYPANFEEFADPGSYTRFNTISAKKVLCGCKSDGIPALALECGMKGEKIYKAFLEYLVEKKINCSYANTTNWKLLAVFARDSGLFTPVDYNCMLQRVKLVYPEDCPEGLVIEPVWYRSVDQEKLAKFLTLVNDAESLRCLALRRVQLGEADKQLMFDKSNRLKTGEYAADNNLEPQPGVEVHSLSLNAFEKEF